MAILNARSPRFRSGGDRGPDTGPPSRTSSGAGPAPNPGDFAGLFDSPSESTSTTSSTTRSPSSTGVSPGVFGSESDFASYTLSTTSSPTSRPTSAGGSASGSASQRGSSSGGSVGGGLPPATIVGIVAGVVSFIFLSSFIHFWSREKKRSFVHRSRFRHEKVLWKSVKITTGMFVITWLWKRCRRSKDPGEPEYFKQRGSVSDMSSRQESREVEYTPCEPAWPGQAPELCGHSVEGQDETRAEERRGSAGGGPELESGPSAARPSVAAQSPGR